MCVGAFVLFLADTLEALHHMDFKKQTDGEETPRVLTQPCGGFTRVGREKPWGSVHGLSVCTTGGLPLHQPPPFPFTII